MKKKEDKKEAEKVDKKDDIIEEKEDEKEDDKEDKKETVKEYEKNEDKKKYKPLKNFGGFRKNVNAKKRHSFKLFTFNNPFLKLDNLNAPFKKRKTNKTITLKTPIKLNINFDKILFPNQNLVINTTDEMVKEEIKIQEKDETQKKDETEKKDEEEKKYKNKNEIKKNEIISKYQDLNDEELTGLDYEEAIIADKRTYWQLYFSLLKKDQLILFTFFRKDDYNLPQIKILLFIVSFAFFFAVNAFFFTDETMDNIYKVNGVFNFILQIPQILYSSIITSIISMILQKLSISEEDILEIKKEKDLKKSKEKANKILKNLKFKIILFLVISSILMIFFSYFISCFCAVYGNTQFILIEDTLLSFGSSLIYPFGFKLLPGLFRIPALRSKNKNKKLMYKISKLLNLI